MEQVNLAQPEKRSLRDKLERALRLSVVPLVLLAAGCGRDVTSSSLDTVSEKPKIGLSEKEMGQEKSDSEILLECLIRVSGDSQSVDTLDNGDWAILIGDEVFRLDDEAKEKILSTAKEYRSDNDLDFNFEKIDIKIQNSKVRKEIMELCPKLSSDELTPGLREIIKVREELRQLTRPKSQGGIYETKDGEHFLQEEGGDHIHAEIKTNPDAKDFL